MIGSELLRFKDKQKYLLFDTETEGLNLFFSRPWQIAYAICNNKEIESIVVRYIKWDDLNVSDEAARVTRFNKEFYLSQAEDPRKVLEDVYPLFTNPDNMLLGHNILGFDHYIMNTWCRLCNMPLLENSINKSIDTLCLSRAYRFNIKPESNNFIAWQYKMLTKHSRAKGMGASLGSISKEFEINYDSSHAHDALYDTNINFQVFQKLLWAMDI